MTPYKRGRFYYVELKPAGYPEKIGPVSTRFTSKRKAERVEATIRDLAATGRHDLLDAVRTGEVTPAELYTARLAGRLDTLLEEKADRPLAEATQEFIETYPGAARNYKPPMRRLVEAAGEGAKLSAACDPEVLRRVVTAIRKKGLSGGTERRNMAGISIFLRLHFGDEARDAAFERLKLRPEGEHRTRYLSPEEIEAVRRECPEDWWTLFGTLLATGLRLGEALALRVRDIDFEHGQVRVLTGKTKASRRTVPLRGEMLDRLRDWTEEHGLSGGDRVWPAISNNMAWHAWDPIRREVGIEDVRIHDLRHTYAVHCAKSGMPLPELKARLGHQTIAMTMRYAVYSPPGPSSHYEAALGRMGLGEADVLAFPKRAEGGA